MRDGGQNSGTGEGGFGALGRLSIALGGIWIAQRALGAKPSTSFAPVAVADARGSGDGVGGRDERNGAGDPKPQSTAGRGADSPDDIPARGWKEIVFRVWEEIGNDRVVAVAAGVTFYVLLAIFPAITALVSVYGLFADPSTIQQHLASISSLVPGGAMDVIGGQIERIVSQGEGTLGFALALGLGTSLWSSNAGMKAMFDALNVAYGEKESRGFIALNATSLAFTAGMLAFALLALASAIVIPIALKYVGLGSTVETLISWLRWPVLLVVLVFGLALLYRFGPTRKKPHWQWITVGSGFAGIAWMVASAGFSWYAANFGSYNETYGTLGAAIGFMTWVWISVTVILVGAELNSEVEAQAKGSSEA
jgi:membrane protein